MAGDYCLGCGIPVGGGTCFCASCQEKSRLFFNNLLADVAKHSFRPKEAPEVLEAERIIKERSK